MASIFVVEDNPPMRHVLRGVLGMHHGWHVAGEASNGREAVAKFPSLMPDITVMDFKMPEVNGIEAAQAILEKYPAAAILILTLYQSEALTEAARKVGIRGVCSKLEMWSVLDAIDALLAGTTYFPLQSGERKFESLLRDSHTP